MTAEKTEIIDVILYPVKQPFLRFYLFINIIYLSIYYRYVYIYIYIYTYYIYIYVCIYT